MNEKLKQWLQTRWKYDNHVKYQKYFDDWLSNLTEGQINGFAIQLEQLENGSMEKWDTKK